MGKYVFTKEEKEDIKKSLELIIDDIRNLWNICRVDRIKVGIPMGDCLTDFCLRVDKHKIRICEIDSWTLFEHNHTIERKTRKGSKKRIPNYNLAFNFVNVYEQHVRPAIVSVLKTGLSELDKGFEKMDAIQQQYDKHAEIKFEVGDAIAEPMIVLSQEEGKNIGTLHIGGRTLKIIVDGPIKIVDNTKNQELASVKKISRKGYY